MESRELLRAQSYLRLIYVPLHYDDNRTFFAVNSSSPVGECETKKVFFSVKDFKFIFDCISYVINGHKNY